MLPRTPRARGEITNSKGCGSRRGTSGSHRSESQKDGYEPVFSTGCSGGSWRRARRAIWTHRSRSAGAFEGLGTRPWQLWLVWRDARPRAVDEGIVDREPLQRLVEAGDDLVQSTGLEALTLRSAGTSRMCSKHDRRDLPRMMAPEPPGDSR